MQCGPFKETGLIEQQADDDYRNERRCCIPDERDFFKVDDSRSQRQHGSDTCVLANAEASGLPDDQDQREYKDTSCQNHLQSPLYMFMCM